MFNAYGGFKNKLGTDVDVIGMNDDFSSYKIIVLPNHRITTDEQAKRLEEFVFNGGIVVMNTECGTRDEANLMRELNQPG
ncbi:MAG TPA: hypothetical protein DDY98_03355, partial [Ruminococcaceae bacterium]|nr:hypothetical protein [Oscillospiraceae bacterium]